MPKNLIEKSKSPIQLVVVLDKNYPAWLKEQSKTDQAWLKSNGFMGKDSELILLPHPDGSVSRAILGWTGEEPWAFSIAAQKLPKGEYALAGDFDPNQAVYGWGLANYAFTAYKKADSLQASLVWPKDADRETLTALLEARFWVRDWINTPAADMGPEALAKTASQVFKNHGGKVSITLSEPVLKKNFPLVHAVGKASSDAPRLIDARWRHPKAKRKVTLVGKGVCFDTGGLDIKSDTNMMLMKKDMGGAAHVLALAHVIMATKMPIDLRVIIPAVENSVAGNAMHPLDIIKSRKGLTVEIGHTDAEGRLILADGLALACEDKPDLIIDIATLTGAARVALGAEVPALFCNDDKTAAALISACEESGDPIWRMPLYAPYAKSLKSAVADLNNIGKSSLGGAITAALFLEKFVEPTIPWIHIDMMAWNASSTPGRPEGGEAMCLCGLTRFLKG